ncbi:MAG: Sec-independent protein translocase protein TatB [Xanthobacteraceae bacterium]
MFDISWTEFVLIGVVALIVIGPKELPGVMRTIGQWTRKIRGMAADFQRQFEREMRDAEVADLKKQVDDIAQDVKGYDPLKDVRSDVEAIGKDFKASLEGKEPPANAAQPVGESLPETAADLPNTDIGGATTGPVPPEATEKSADALPAPAPAVEPREKHIVAAAVAAIGPVTPETVEEAQPADSTRRTA